ncbi:MAG: isochorismatase family protein, partial [Candidatus Hodarchaeales archaeon]
GLEGYLQSLGVTRVFTCGLAMDYCVYYSAVDAKSSGFDVIYILDLTKPVGSPEGIVSDALERMVSEGIDFVNSENIY